MSIVRAPLVLLHAILYQLASTPPNKTPPNRRYDNTESPLIRIAPFIFKVCFFRFASRPHPFARRPCLRSTHTRMSLSLASLELSASLHSHTRPFSFSTCTPNLTALLSPADPATTRLAMHPRRHSPRPFPTSPPFCPLLRPPSSPMSALPPSLRNLCHSPHRPLFHRSHPRRRRHRSPSRVLPLPRPHVHLRSYPPP